MKAVAASSTEPGIDSIPDPSTAIDGRSRRRGRNAELLYNAADDLLSSHSYESLTIDDICERAGVGRATFFRIFETKAGLLREFNRRLAADAEDRLRAVGETDVRTALDVIRRAVIDAWRHAGRGHVGMAADFTRTTPSSNPHAAHPELLKLVTDHVSRALRSGELSCDVPVEIAASLAVIHMTAPIAFSISGHDVDIDALSKTLLNQWYAGMSAPTAERPKAESRATRKRK